MSDNIRNTIYKDEMYNRERKEKFLNQDRFSDDSKKTYKRVFLISRGLEETWNKDLVDFTIEELKDLLTGMKPLTKTASKSNIALVYSYLEWCIENGYRNSQSNINQLQSVRTNSDFISQFVRKDIQIYITKEELDNIVDDCANEQDSAIFYSLFEGITTHELAQMKKEDIKDDYVLLRDKEGKFKKDENGDILKFNVSPKCIDLLNGAAEEKFYHVSNGVPAEKARFETVDLIENDYVIRVGKTNNKTPMKPVGQHIIRSRVESIGEFVKNLHITPKNIIKSGYIYEGYKLWVEAGKPNLPDGVLTTEMYQAICKKFNLPKVKNGKYIAYNTNPLRQYVTLFLIKDYYQE